VWTPTRGTTRPLSVLDLESLSHQRDLGSKPVGLLQAASVDRVDQLGAALTHASFIAAEPGRARGASPNGRSWSIPCGSGRVIEAVRDGVWSSKEVRQIATGHSIHLSPAGLWVTQALPKLAAPVQVTGDSSARTVAERSLALSLAWPACGVEAGGAPAARSPRRGMRSCRSWTPSRNEEARARQSPAAARSAARSVGRTLRARSAWPSGVGCSPSGRLSSGTPPTPRM